MLALRTPPAEDSGDDRAVFAEATPGQGRWTTCIAAATTQSSKLAVAEFHEEEEEDALVRTAVEEADNVRVLEFGDDGHPAFEGVDGAGVGLSAGEQDSGFQMDAGGRTERPAPGRLQPGRSRPP